MLGLTSMQEALNAKTLSWSCGHRKGTTLFKGVPTLSFFLYASRYAWGVGDVSDTAVPFLDPYRPVSLNAYRPTVF
jgi:hypothetical protein